MVKTIEIQMESEAKWISKGNASIVDPLDKITIIAAHLHVNDGCPTSTGGDGQAEIED